jgi:hypothetical protein
MPHELRTLSQPEPVRVGEGFAATGQAVQCEYLLFGWRPVSLRVREVIATRLGLLEAVAQAPGVEAEYQYEEEQAKGELNLAADPALRGIYESDLNRIRVARVESVEVFVVPVSSMFPSNRSFLLCLSFSTTTETKPRQQLAERKVDYPD